MEHQPSSASSAEISESISAGVGTTTSAKPGRRPEFSVADICRNQPDECERMVDEVFFKRRHYAIYSANGQIRVKYADDDEIATAQIRRTAPLGPLKDKLQFFVKGRNVPGCYHSHIAAALHLALEDQADSARETLEGAIQDVLGYKARIGRSMYLAFAGPLAVATAMALAAWSAVLLERGVMALGLLLLSAGGGAMGALLSIAIALRTRTVAVDDDWKANLLDGSIRLVIGVISAAALFLILNAGLVANIGSDMVRSAGTSPELAWQTALIVGFAAGFFERMVPDLLERGFEQVPKVSTQPGAA